MASYSMLLYATVLAGLFNNRFLRRPSPPWRPRRCHPVQPRRPLLSRRFYWIKSTHQSVYLRTCAIRGAVKVCRPAAGWGMGRRGGRGRRPASSASPRRRAHSEAQRSTARGQTSPSPAESLWLPRKAKPQYLTGISERNSEACSSQVPLRTLDQQPA